MTDHFVSFILKAVLKQDLGDDIMISRGTIVLNSRLPGYVTTIHLRVIGTTMVAYDYNRSEGNIKKYAAVPRSLKV